MTPYLAAILRCSAGVWHVLDDAGHAPIGVQSVEALPDRVRVHHDPVGKIHGVSCDADESYVRAGIAAGASAGLAYLDVMFARNGAPATPSSVSSVAGSNVWLLAYGSPA